MCTTCNKLKNIYKGYKNLVFENPEIEQQYSNKVIICNECEHIKLFKIVDNVKIYYCNICKCPLSAKLRSNDNCPINKF